MALGLIGGLTNGWRGYSSYGGGDERYVDGALSSTANSASQILNRQLNILPTVTIREGYQVNVYLTEDIQLPSYGGDSKEELQ